MEQIQQAITTHSTSRQELLAQASALRGERPTLSKAETLLNQKLVDASKDLKGKLSKEFYTNPLKFRDLIEGSELYKLLKPLPKGSLHHGHLACFGPPKFFLDTILSKPEWFKLDTKAKRIYFYKAKEAAELPDFKALADKLTKEEFYAEFTGYFALTLVDINESAEMWPSFQHKVSNRMSIMCYKDFYRSYIRDTCEFALEDKIFNLQMRIFLGVAKNENLENIPLEEEMQMYIDVEREIQAKHPEFSFTAIVQGLRFWPVTQLREYIEKAIQMKKKFPDLIIGFDVVADEDTRKLGDLCNLFVEYREEVKKQEIQNFDYFLHAGESLMTSNDNIIDAVLLDCPRIGHGLNLYRFPVLFERIRKHNVCIEWNPLSNQILRYVKDLRNHPHFGMVEHGIKFSISSDDPGIFGTDAVTWDFVSLVLAFDFDLPVLKQFIKNSVDYSQIPERQKEKLQASWEQAWDAHMINIVE